MRTIPLLETTRPGCRTRLGAFFLNSVLAVGLLAGCQGGAFDPGRASTDTAPERAPYEQRAFAIAGNDAASCGKLGPVDRLVIASAELDKAGECAAAAWRDGKPFVFSVEEKSGHAVGLVGMRDKSGFFRFDYVPSCAGAGACDASFALVACPAIAASAELDARLCKLPVAIATPTPTQAANAEPPVVRSADMACRFPDAALGDDFVVLATGAYTGRKLDFQIDQSGQEASQIDVQVSRTDKPVALLLGAYDATIWNVSWASGTRIVAVFVSGYHRQVIAGLDPSVPRIVSTYDNRGPCGYVYVMEQELPKLNPVAKRVFGRAVDLVYLADKDGRAAVGDGLAPGQTWLSSNDTQPQSFRDASAPLAGDAGLEDAVRKGLIRPATRSDAEAWVDAVVARTPQGASPPIAGRGPARPSAPGLYRAYVVLKPMQFPAGLYGAHSATFFVPKGVPLPTGNAGHSAVLDFNTMNCGGPLCR